MSTEIQNKYGGLTEEEIKSNKPEYYSLNYQKAKFVKGDLEFAGVRGKFLGIGKNSFEFEGDTIYKFIVFLRNETAIMQVQIGFDTWACLQLMNLLKNCNRSLTEDTIVTISLSKAESKKTSIFLDVNGQYIKQYKKWKDLKFPDDADKKTAYRDKIIAKWFDDLSEYYLYMPGNVVVTDSEETSDDDDNIPF